MKILISPPMRFGKKFTGAARRTLKIYSKIPNVSLCIDSSTFPMLDEAFMSLIAMFKIVNSNSTSGIRYLIGFIRCLHEAKTLT